MSLNQIASSNAEGFQRRAEELSLEARSRPIDSVVRKCWRWKSLFRGDDEHALVSVQDLDSLTVRNLDVIEGLSGNRETEISVLRSLSDSVLAKNSHADSPPTKPYLKSGFDTENYNEKFVSLGR